MLKSFVCLFIVLLCGVAVAELCPRCKTTVLPTDAFCADCGFGVSEWRRQREVRRSAPVRVVHKSVSRNEQPASQPIATVNYGLSGVDRNMKKSNVVQPYHRQSDRIESRNRIQKDKIFTFSHNVVDENESGIITPLKFSIFNSCSLPSDDCCRVYGFDMALLGSLNYEVAGIGISALGATCHSLYGLSVAFFSQSEKAFGIQIGWFNIADELYGLQIGFINNAGSESCGLQIGVINIIGSFSDNRTIPVVNMNF